MELTINFIGDKFNTSVFQKAIPYKLEVLTEYDVTKKNGNKNKTPSYGMAFYTISVDSYQNISEEIKKQSLLLDKLGLKEYGIQEIEFVVYHGDDGQWNEIHLTIDALSNLVKINADLKIVEIKK